MQAGGRVENGVAGDGELFETREDAVFAAWGEYEAVMKEQEEDKKT